MKFQLSLIAAYLGAIASAEIVQFKVQNTANRCIAVTSNGMIAFMALNATAEVEFCKSYSTTFGLDTLTGQLTIGDQVVGFDRAGFATVKNITTSGLFQLDRGVLKTQKDKMSLLVSSGAIKQIAGLYTINNQVQLVTVNFSRYLPTLDAAGLKRLQGLVTSVKPKQFKISIPVSGYNRCASVTNGGWVGFGAQLPETDLLFCQQNFTATTFTFHADSGQLQLGSFLVGFKPAMGKLAMTTSDIQIPAKFKLANNELVLVQPSNSSLYGYGGVIMGDGPVGQSSNIFKNLQYF